MRAGPAQSNMISAVDRIRTKMEHYLRTMFRLSLLLLASCAASACTSVVDIKIDDDVSFSNLETSFALTQEDNPRIRFRGTRVSGDLDQSLQPGEQIGIGGDFVRGPAQVSGEIDLNYFSLAVGEIIFVFIQDDQTYLLYVMQGIFINDVNTCIQCLPDIATKIIVVDH